MSSHARKSVTYWPVRMATENASESAPAPAEEMGTVAEAAETHDPALFTVNIQLPGGNTVQMKVRCQSIRALG